MKLITVAGPPSSGKTSIITKTIHFLKNDGFSVGVIKFDCLSTVDNDIYKKNDVPIITGLSGGLCPDHFFVSNIQECFEWGQDKKLDILISESAGLCNRCSPHIKEVLAVCVIDNLSGINTPKKIGPMLRYADIIIITKGDIVSQAEREVFAYRVKKANFRAKIVFANGLTGQGTSQLADLFSEAPESTSMSGKSLRFTMPAALCSYCLGEREIGEDCQIGNIKKMFKEG